MLKVNHLNLKIGDFSLQDINIKLDKGKHLVILGKSGSGKTLLLETLAGRYMLDGGEIFIDNINVTDTSPEKRKIGFVYQNYELFPHLNVCENIAFPLKIRNKSQKEIEDKINFLTKIFNIEGLENRNVKKLSGGEKQRVAICRALAMSPKILFLDEPFSALDYLTKERMKKFLKEFCNEFAITTIHVTHDITEALYFADKIYIMNDGRIIEKFDVNEKILERGEEFFYGYL